MNIFVLHEDPITAAKHHCDKHVVKMILESAQLLCTAHREFVQCMPDEYKDPDPVAAYRNYYRGDKAYMAQWQYSKIPTWWGER